MSDKKGQKKPPAKRKQNKVATKPDKKKAPVKSEAGGFEPKIIAFLCNWCSYAGADLAGVSRYQYPTNTRTVRVMCSSRVDPVQMVEMFIHGADGVLVGGCHLGDCHYITGNYYTEKKFKLAKKLLTRSGFNADRLRLEWVSASEGERFSKVVNDFVNQIKELGPNPVAGKNPDMDMMEGLFAAKNAARDFRLRSLVAREIQLTEKGNVYDNLVSKNDFDTLLDSAIDEEMARQKILFLTMERPMSVLEISSETEIPSEKVLQHIVTLKDRGVVEIERYDGVMPLYVAPKEEVFR
jgi:coenzyme F420-reducing hydrogenase delta subunit/DNA-binding transcriptional ArsR family regulator